MPQTENTSIKDWQESGWTLTALNLPVITVAPPPPIALKGKDAEESPAFDFKLVHLSGKRFIDPLTHERLLDQSLEEYETIWRILAER